MTTETFTNYYKDDGFSIDLWDEDSYVAKENLTIDELIKEKYNGIRPAPGYPACPDHCEKDKIWSMLNVPENTGVTLTETRAMYPTASICGWYFSHPNAKYFSLGNKFSSTTNAKHLETRKHVLPQNNNL